MDTRTTIWGLIWGGGGGWGWVGARKGRKKVGTYVKEKIYIIKKNKVTSIGQNVKKVEKRKLI